jgi:hypothetical protein
MPVIVAVFACSQSVAPKAAKATINIQRASPPERTNTGVHALPTTIELVIVLERTLANFWAQDL